METIIQEQPDLFNPSRWPKKPYCSDDLEVGLRIRNLSTALKKPYIQANPPNLRIWSIYDVDRGGAAVAWEDAMLPPPSWASVNRANGHAHLVWGLSVPVLVDSPDMRQKPLRYLCAVEAAFRAGLQADQGYSGLITKNPVHPLWRTLRGPQLAYELRDLAEYVDLPKHLPKRNPEEIGLGRNVTVFDWLRRWAYVAVRQHRDTRNFILWQAESYDKALERNGDLLNPLASNEVWAITKSVAKWVWRKDAEARDAFSKRQSWKGRKGGVASGVSRTVANARLMRAGGMTQAAIAQALGVSQQNVSNWTK